MGDKLTLRLDKERKEALGRIVEERKKQNPNANLSDLVRDAIDTFVGLNDDPYLFMEQVVRKARAVGITPDELKGALATIYKTLDYQAQKAQETEQKDYQG
jgi:hypothetical protein